MPLYKQFQSDMMDMGYADYFVEKANGVSASAIFYKKAKFICMEQNFI
jgi:hypothetical protein